MKFHRLLVILMICQTFACREADEVQPLVQYRDSWVLQGIVKTASDGQENILDVSLNLNTDSTFEFRKLGNQGLVTGTHDDFSQLRSTTLRVQNLMFKNWL